MCGLEVGSGPPTTTGLPAARQSSIRRSVSACCGSMPPVNTTSAQVRSSSPKACVLQSISRTVQSFGSIAATVIRPRGAAGRFTPISSQDSPKLQNDSAKNSG
ncbi:hypothetical protein ACVWXN_005673 [Bradyrhizobium sp. i1.4.4]